MQNNSVAALFTLAKTNNKKKTLANYVPCQMLVHLRKCLNKSLATAQQFMVSNYLHGNPFVFSTMQLSKSGVAAPLKSILPCGKTAENDVTLSKEDQIHVNNLTNKKSWLLYMSTLHVNTRAGTRSLHHPPMAHHPARMPLHSSRHSIIASSSHCSSSCHFREVCALQCALHLVEFCF